MNLETLIAELLAQADPLRELADDDPAKAPLGPLVDKINALRAEQASEAMRGPSLRPEVAAVLGDTPREAAELAAKHARAVEEVAAAKRSPGRPKKEK